MGYLSLVCDLRERNDDEKRSIVPFLLHEVGDESNGLNGLTKTHLVCQDPVEMVVVQRHKPFQPFDLVRMGGFGEGGRRGGKEGREERRRGRKRRQE